MAENDDPGNIYFATLARQILHLVCAPSAQQRQDQQALYSNRNFNPGKKYANNKHAFSIYDPPELK